MIPSRLEHAAALLAQRTNLTLPPYELYSEEVWSIIETKIPGLAPTWYRYMTQKYRLGGVYFHYPIDPQHDYIGAFCLPRPSMALVLAYHEWPLPQLLSHGFCAFAEGEDGNIWVFRRDEESDPYIHFIRSTAWNGGPPTFENGLLSSNLRMSEFFEYAAKWKSTDED
jgi:hypothetical protein